LQSARECLDTHVPTVHAAPAVRRCEAGGTLPRRVEPMDSTVGQPRPFVRSPMSRTRP
jgi:hypothetical protein